MLRSTFLKLINKDISDIKEYFSDNYPHTISIFDVNNQFKVYNDDAKVFFAIINSNNNKINNVCCIFNMDIKDKIFSLLNKYNVK